MLSRPWKYYCSDQGKPPPAIMISPLSVPTLADKIRIRGLDDEDQSTNVTNDQSIIHTEAFRGVARTPRTLPEVARGTMHKVVMLVPDLVKKVDAVRALQ